MKMQAIVSIEARRKERRENDMAKGSELISNCIETAKAMDEVLATAE